MTVVTTDRSIQSQIGVVTAPGAAYAQAGNSISFAAGQAIVMRFPTRIPPGSLINDAYIAFEVTAKDNAVAGTSYHNLKAHRVGDSPQLVVGETAVGYRPKTVAGNTNLPIVYPGGNPSSAVIQTMNVRTILTELLTLPDWVMGGYVTIYLTCETEGSSDNGIIGNNVFFFTPRLTVDFTEPNTDVRYVTNLCQNSELSNDLLSIDPAAPVPYWTQNEFLGSFVPPANWGTIAPDPAMARIVGTTTPSVRFTAPAAVSPPKSTGPTHPVLLDRGKSWVFCGWIFVSAAIPTTVTVAVEFVFYASTFVVIPERGQWVPFCTNPFVTPLDPNTNASVFWPAAAIQQGYVGGEQIWISEPTILESTFRQLGFNGKTPEGNFVDNYSTVSKQQSGRKWTPRTTMMVNGVPKRMPTWTKLPSGILQLSEPVKGGPQIGQLPAGVTVGDLPTNMTVTELL